jgi:hypothetical protein
MRGYMKQEKAVHWNQPAGPAGPNRRTFLRLLGVLAAITILGTLSWESQAAAQVPSGCPASGVPLKPGDIVYADSGDAIQGGFIVKVDGVTGQSSVISCGGVLRLPFDLAIDAEGQIVVSDSGQLLRIDPETGAQSVIADNSRGTLGCPYGLSLNRAGGIVAANLAAIIEVNPVTGLAEAVSAGGYLGCPLGVAVANNGQLFVLNIGRYARQILRVNPQTGVQRLVTQAGYLKNPQAIAVQGNDLYITDVATPDGNFGIGRVIHVDAQTGAQTVVAEGGNLIGPVGITFDASGQLIVGDPYTINPQSPDLADGGYDGGIIRIDPVTGSQALLARGEGSHVNPRGVAVVPLSVPGRATQAGN